MSDVRASGPSGASGPGPSLLVRGRSAWAEWREHPEDRFGVLLFFVVATIAVSSVLDAGTSYRSALLVHAMSAAALIAAARATALSIPGRRAVLALVIVALGVMVVLALAETFADDGPWRPGRGASPLWLVLAVAVPVLVLRRLAQHTEVGARTVLGSVAAYLQIAVAYAALFLSVDAWTGRASFGAPLSSSDYTYVSLTSISTLGIGDVAPATDLMRLLVASEAVAGQVFLVTIVAIVVSSFAEQRRSRPPASRPPASQP